MSATFLEVGVQSLAAILAGAVTDRWDVSMGFVVIGGICVPKADGEAGCPGDVSALSQRRA